ncbi:MAG: hypothetical protein AB1327_07960 [Bacillota bacterium]
MGFAKMGYRLSVLFAILVILMLISVSGCFASSLENYLDAQGIPAGSIIYTAPSKYVSTVFYLEGNGLSVAWLEQRWGCWRFMRTYSQLSPRPGETLTWHGCTLKFPEDDMHKALTCIFGIASDPQIRVVKLESPQSGVIAVTDVHEAEGYRVWCVVAPDIPMGCRITGLSATGEVLYAY